MADYSNGYYLGMDIGTDSVGWAVTDGLYHVLKYKGNAMWGISLFDAANQAAERRSFRTARRRLDRKNQRELLLQELFAKEISNVDTQFYLRRKESALWAEDRTASETGILGMLMTDKQYHFKYPTIHHLITELMSSSEPHDIRLVFIACSYILAHRGHFFMEVDVENVDKVTDFTQVMNDLFNWYDSQELPRPFECEIDEFGDILKNERRISERERKFKELLWGGKKPEKSDDCPDALLMIKLISGSKNVKLSELFGNEAYEELEHNAICLGNADFDEILEALYSELDGEDASLIKILKAIYDWSQLVNILHGRKYISEAKVDLYEQHRHDLELLKRLVRKYLPKKYSEVFRTADKKLSNYVRYSGNVKSADISRLDKFEKASSEDFCRYIKGLFKGVTPASEDKNDFDYMIDKLELNNFCPKQVNGDNRVIPYQLYYCELKKILENAEKYLPFLSESDEYGSVSDKILSIMQFRVPYYVGPLASGGKHAWITRKTGRITPWNFNDMVDRDNSENDFIRRMTATCTYAAGEDVLPKNSLLYTKFMVLNEINNIRINGQRIDSQTKQGLFENVFMQNRKVTAKKIREYLVSQGKFIEGKDKLDGIDITVKSSLKPWIDFRNLINRGILTEEQAEEIILRITATTDKGRLKKWLISNYHLSTDDAVYISKLGYTDFGRLSEKLLNGIVVTDPVSGEVKEGTIIEAMWNGCENLMELLSAKHGYYAVLEQMNSEYYAEHKKSIMERLSDMYVPTAVRRSVVRSIEIASELKKLTGRAPDKIFIEMARDNSGDLKGKRTISRKAKVREYLKAMKADELIAELDSKSEGELRGDKLYLYFMQLGKCMYSGEPIDLESLATKAYDIDHIFPQSRVKDDSIDNRVLVKSELNGAKSDEYPIDKEIRSKMRDYWDMLHKNGLISDKKYERLTRSTPFTDEELADFINRQLVETRQSTKAVSVLLKEMFPESEIVYVKAGIVSEFRHQYDLLKCREVNDLHHAKDAYLNIVLGNVFDVMFTKNPINFIRENNGKKRYYSMKIEKLLANDIQRGGITAWKKDETLEVVKKQMAKNNIRFVRYSFCQKGALFDQMPLRKGNFGQIPRKAGLDKNKYGAYQKATISYYHLVKYIESKKTIVSIIPVELRLASKLTDIQAIRAYCANELGIDNAQVLLNGRKIKVNTLFDIDGFRVSLSCRSNDRIWFKSGMQLVLPQKYELYVNRISSFCEKVSEAAKSKAAAPAITVYDKLNTDDNLALYDILLDKVMNTAFRVLMDTPLKVLKENREHFVSLSLEDQVLALSHIVELFSCTTSSGKDLTLIKGSKSSGILNMSMLLNSKRFKVIRIIDQSPTGLIERCSENLFDL